VCVFITAGPSTKMFTWGGGRIWEDMCYERRRAEACVDYCKSNNFWQSSNLAVQNGFISRGSSGLRNYFVWQNCGGVRVQVLEFLQHSVCTGTLYCVLIARTQGPDLIQRGGIALRTATAAAAKTAAGALWQPGGRAGPGTLPT
jgi:hypothetical protein